MPDGEVVGDSGITMGYEEMIRIEWGKRMDQKLLPVNPNRSSGYAS
jgi:hypothetical protein